jgi:hypothetical protein
LSLNNIENILFGIKIKMLGWAYDDAFMLLHLIFCVVWFWFLWIWIQNPFWKWFWNIYIYISEMNNSPFFPFAARWPGGLQTMPVCFPPALLLLLGPPEAGRAAHSVPSTHSSLLCRVRVGQPRCYNGGRPPSSLYRWQLGSTCQSISFLVSWASWSRARPQPNSPEQSGISIQIVVSWGYIGVAASAVFSFSILTPSRTPSTRV